MAKRAANKFKISKSQYARNAYGISTTFDVCPGPPYVMEMGNESLFKPFARSSTFFRGQAHEQYCLPWAEAKVLTLSMIDLNRSNHLAFQDLMDSWLLDIILEVLQYFLPSLSASCFASWSTFTHSLGSRLLASKHKTGETNSAAARKLLVLFNDPHPLLLVVLLYSRSSSAQSDKLELEKAGKWQTVATRSTDQAGNHYFVCIYKYCIHMYIYIA